MRIKLGFVLGAFVLALVGVAVTPAASAPEDGEWLCHLTGKGYKLIWVSDSARAVHIAHGDIATTFEVGWDPDPSVCDSV